MGKFIQSFLCMARGPSSLKKFQIWGLDLGQGQYREQHGPERGARPENRGRTANPGSQRSRPDQRRPQAWKKGRKEMCNEEKTFLNVVHELIEKLTLMTLD